MIGFSCLWKMGPTILLAERIKERRGVFDRSRGGPKGKNKRGWCLGGGGGGDNGQVEENMHHCLRHPGVTNTLQVSLWDNWGFQQFVCNTFNTTAIPVWSH